MLCVYVTAERDARYRRFTVKISDKEEIRGPRIFLLSEELVKEF